MGDKDSKTDPQWNWLSQRYRDKFRVLFLAIEEFYDSLERDNPFSSDSVQIEKILAELKDEDAESVDASIAAALRQADEREANKGASKQAQHQGFPLAHWLDLAIGRS
jgi:hypothetical protein